MQNISPPVLEPDHDQLPLPIAYKHGSLNRLDCIGPLPELEVNDLEHKNHTAIVDPCQLDVRDAVSPYVVLAHHEKRDAWHANGVLD